MEFHIENLYIVFSCLILVFFRVAKYNATIQNTIDCTLGAQTVVTARFVGAQGHGKGASKPSRMVHESTVSAMISGESMTIVIGEKGGKYVTMLVLHWWVTFMIMLHTSHSYSVSVISHSLPSQARNRVISLFSSHSLPSKARNRAIILFSKIQSLRVLIMS